MKKVVLSLAFVATLAVVSCKDANAEAPVVEEVATEEVVVEETVVDTAAAVVVDTAAAVVAPVATEEAAK